MGVNYRPVLAIGKQFDDESEALTFCLDNKIEIDEQHLSEEGLSECLPEGMDGSLLNYYNSDGYWLGFRVRCCDPESFRKSFEDGMESWDKLFPNVPADVVHTVVIS